MELTATSRWFRPFSMMAAMAILANPASAQTPIDLGSEFILFVDGLNVLVPASQAATIADPLDGTGVNKVLDFAVGDWASVSIAFDPIDVGANLSAMVSEDPAATKTLYAKVLIDPSFVGRGVCTPTGDGCLSLSLFDATGGGQDRPSLEAGTGDPQMRLKWFIDDSLKTGTWQQLAIPLPPSTLAALEGARTAGTLDPVQAGWHYTGAWAGGFGVGCCGSAGALDADAAWQEFQWGNVSWIGIHNDFADGQSGSVLIDDLYIGDATTDLASASGAPAAMSGVTFSADGANNHISWTHNPDFGGYKVYVDENPITQASLDAGGPGLVASKAFNAAEFAVDHAYEIPHPSMAGMDLYYAVTSTSQFGVENTDVSASSGAISNANLAVQGYIIEVTNDESDLIVANVIAGTPGADGFPAGTIPFQMNAAHSKTGDGPLPPGGDADASGTFWIGFNRDFNELYVYAEIEDDVISRHPGGAACNGCETWGYDSTEFGWGSYDVRDAGGSLLGGSPHQDMGREEAPDVQLRLAWLADGNASTFVSGGGGCGDDCQGEIVSASTVYAATATGYSYLSLMPLNSFVFPITNDQGFVPPADGEVKLIPFNIAYNDGDGEDGAGGSTRDAQMIWSIKGNAGGGWWNTPAMWMTVAVAGRGTNVANEPEGELPQSYSLEQNYPNPFNPTTSIDFSLPTAENVTLSVYNVLGQRVATLINGETMVAGRHQVRFDALNLTSGMYLVKLDAGSAFSQTRSMMLLK
ncbi:MAG: hypothetical protein ACI80V_002287 [Rhodothermales bacterium]|jgi:hypothetical protein